MFCQERRHRNQNDSYGRRKNSTVRKSGIRVGQPTRNQTWTADGNLAPSQTDTQQNYLESNEENAAIDNMVDARRNFVIREICKQNNTVRPHTVSDNGKDY